MKWNEDFYNSEDIDRICKHYNEKEDYCNQLEMECGIAVQPRCALFEEKKGD